MRYKIELWEEVGGYAYIDANTKEEAEAKAQQLLDDEGIEGFDNKTNAFDTTHRSTEVLSIEEDNNG
jgi:hypothetical protein